METQHTISEMTVNNQTSDVQFLFGKYEELQSECNKLKLLNNKLLEENHELEDRLSEVKDSMYLSYDIIRNLRSYLTDIAYNKKLTKAAIISDIKSTLPTFDSVRKELAKW